VLGIELGLEGLEYRGELYASQHYAPQDSGRGGVVEESMPRREGQWVEGSQIWGCAAASPPALLKTGCAAALKIPFLVRENKKYIYIYKKILILNSKSLEIFFRFE
jgi:hypothetical protein